VNIVIFGPPGAGKGTQSAFLINQFNFFQLSTGDLLRNELKSGSTLAFEIENLMNSGKLVSDDIINNLIEKKLTDQSIENRIIFDGFPRNIKQAKTLDSLLGKYLQSISLVLNLKVDYPILSKRISGRVSCSVCKKTFNEFFDPPVSCDHPACKTRTLIKRSDDNEETVTKRLKTYDESTLPILDYYMDKGIVVDVDAMAEIAKVSEQISKIIKDLKS
jgi:adenylate kinase